MVGRERLKTIDEVLTLLRSVPVELDLWGAQNAYFSVAKVFDAAFGESVTPEWAEQFARLGEQLRIRVAP
jgi:hypothetical protein